MLLRVYCIFFLFRPALWNHVLLTHSVFFIFCKLQDIRNLLHLIHYSSHGVVTSHIKFIANLKVTAIMSSVDDIRCFLQPLLILWLLGILHVIGVQGKLRIGRGLTTWGRVETWKVYPGFAIYWKGISFLKGICLNAADCLAVCFAGTNNLLCRNRLYFVTKKGIKEKQVLNTLDNLLPWERFIFPHIHQVHDRIKCTVHSWLTHWIQPYTWWIGTKHKSLIHRRTEQHMGV